MSQAESPEALYKRLMANIEVQKALLTRIQELASTYHDNCAYGRPNHSEAVALAVFNISKGLGQMSDFLLFERKASE
jgi:hypothetical protein